MNQTQFASLVRTTLGLISGIAITYGLGNQAIWADATGVAVGIAPYIWGLISHTDVANAQIAAAIPGVKVEVSPAASASMQKAASDPTQPDIVKK